MKAIPVSELEAHFSEIIARARAGEAFIISDGRTREKVAVLVPCAAHTSKKIRLGLLQDRSLTIRDDFKMTEEGLLD